MPTDTNDFDTLHQAWIDRQHAKWETAVREARLQTAERMARALEDAFMSGMDAYDLRKSWPGHPYTPWEVLISQMRNWLEVCGHMSMDMLAAMERDYDDNGDTPGSFDDWLWDYAEEIEAQDPEPKPEVQG